MNPTDIILNFLYFSFLFIMCFVCAYFIQTKLIKILAKLLGLYNETLFPLSIQLDAQKDLEAQQEIDRKVN